MVGMSEAAAMLEEANQRGMKAHKELIFWQRMVRVLQPIVDEEADWEDD